MESVAQNKPPINDQLNRYLELGWPVFPVYELRADGTCACGRPGCDSPGKHPRVLHGFKDASTDPATIAGWIQRWPGCNWGIPTGEPTGTYVVDIDPRHGGDGHFEALQSEHLGEYIEGPAQRTGGGGEQMFFAWEPGLRNTEGGTPGGLAPGIDTRGSGGYVLVPPSRTQNEYQWLQTPWESELMPLPGWLRPNGSAETVLVAPGGTSGPVPERKIPEGQRNATLASLAGSMRRRGMGEAAILAALRAENSARCNPPLDDAEVEQIAASIARYRPADVVAVPRPEEPGEDYKPFIVVPNAENVPFCEGNAKPNDYARALDAMGLRFTLNEMNDAVYFNGVIETDISHSAVLTYLKERGYKSVETAKLGWTTLAGQNRFHPIREYLRSLTWDGQDHIGKLASYFEDEHGVFATYLRRWLIGAVARPMAKLGDRVENRMLVLVSPQGRGKSYFASWLASPLPQLFLQHEINTEDKDSKVRLLSSWLWEVVELGSTTKRSDREALKGFLTMIPVTVRKAYGHRDIHKPPVASFLGTVNPGDGFLNDPSGHRRFMVANLRKIDWRYASEVDINQVWAQAVALYDAGEPWMLSADESARAEEISEEHSVHNAMVDLVLMHFALDSTAEISAIEILTKLHSLGHIRSTTNRADQMMVGDALVSLGCERRQRKIEGRNVKVWHGIKAKQEVWA